MSTSKEEITKMIKGDEPHVVILGAGASRATCPKGDKNGKKLPLMKDLASCLEIESMLKKWGINPQQNFEDIFSDLYEKDELEKLQKLEKHVYDYMAELKLPEEPTVYDHLLLSLRDKDCIASFNWDPLLLQSYHRNSGKGIELPRLVFLHGNVLAGFCKEHGRINYMGKICEQCKKPLENVKLIYPIKKKNYSENEPVKIWWEILNTHLDRAFKLTIFGYGGPKSDSEAIDTISKHWSTSRFFDDTEFVTNQNEKETYDHWKQFFSSDHLNFFKNFYDTDIANYPRRTFENAWENGAEVHFTEQNPIPKDLDFEDLWEWYSQFTSAEKEYRDKNSFGQKPGWYPDDKS